MKMKNLNKEIKRHIHKISDTIPKSMKKQYESVYLA